MIDKLKIGAAVGLVVLGLWGYYYFADTALVLRVLMVMGGLVAAGFVGYLSAPGKDFFAFAQEAWAQKEKIDVALLSDYEHKVAKDYGVVYDSFLPQLNLGMGGVSKRSAFIIDKNGVIQYTESNDNAKQLPNFDKIKAKLAELK